MRSASLLLYLSLSAPTALAQSSAAAAPAGPARPAARGPGAAVRPAGRPTVGAARPAGGAANVLGPAEPAGPYPNYLELHARTRGFQLGRPQKALPTPDGKAVLFLRATAESPELRLYEFDVESGRSREVLTPSQLLQGGSERLSPEELARRERMRQSLRGFTSFELSPDGSFVLIPFSGRLYVFSRQNGEAGELRPLPDNASRPATSSDSPPPAPDFEPIHDPHLSPDGKLVAYVRGRDLYVLDVASRRERRLTKSTHSQISYGQAEFVAQEELHRFTGHFWSPDSQYLAFTEVDNRPVETLYVGDALRPDLPPQAMRYPRAGNDNASVRLAVVPAQASPGTAATWVEWPRERYPYLASVVWQPGAPLFLTLLSRDQHDVELHAVPSLNVNSVSKDGSSGFVRPPSGGSLKTERLLGEHDDAWVNISQDVPRALPDGSGFLWLSERNGGPELELRDLRGQLLRVLVPREYGFRKIVDVDLIETSSGPVGWLTYSASPEPAEQHVFRMPLLGGAPVQLTKDPGYHLAQFGGSLPGGPGGAGKGHSVYVRQSLAINGWSRTFVHRIPPGGQGQAQDMTAGELPSVASEPPFMPRVELVQLGTQAFRAAIVRPRNFVRGRKYPVLVDVYGGPHHTQVMAMASRYLIDQWLADHGFIVYLTDGRGTPFRGTSWERAISGNFGDIPLEDQVESLRLAGQRFPEMDTKRVGIFGWSFGGYMAALAVLRRPDVFSVGVAGAPVVDWRDYDTCYTERYLGLPQQNREGYEKSSLLTYAKELKNPLLLIHGTADDNVLFVHSLKLSSALFKAGKPHELLPLTGLTHMVPDPLVTERMWTRILTFLASGLKAPLPGAEGARPIGAPGFRRPGPAAGRPR